VDSNEPEEVYTVTDMDKGTPAFGTPGYDWKGEIALVQHQSLNCG
jgi:hypothetical protein